MTRFNDQVQYVVIFTWYNRTNVCFNHGDVRLVNGAGPYEGRVEICYSGVWKTACGTYWRTNNARVVCAQLNYPRQGMQCHALTEA